MWLAVCGSAQTGSEPESDGRMGDAGDASNPDERAGPLRRPPSRAGRAAAALALLEVGGAAGLCLLVDRYGYDYGRRRLGRDEVVFECEPRGGRPRSRPPPAGRV